MMPSIDHHVDPYEQWDAAYVLGSLSPAERHEFELHLADCPRCTAAVAELTPIPGLLSRARSDQVPSAVDARSEVSPAILAGLVKASVRRRSRLRLLVGGLAAVAAAIALIVPLLLSDAGPQATRLALNQVVASPLHADISLVEHSWGTQIDMNCRYEISSNVTDYQSGAREYALYVIDSAGDSRVLSSWLATPGATVEPSATTSLARDDIDRIEVRSVSNGEVLLARDM